MPVVVKFLLAERDLSTAIAYLEINAGIEIAEKFIFYTSDTFQQLAKNPEMGAPVMMPHKKLGRVRKWRVKNFNNYLIFYLPIEDGIAVVRVFHTAQDWWNLYDEEN